MKDKIFSVRSFGILMALLFLVGAILTSGPDSDPSGTWFITGDQLIFLLLAALYGIYFLVSHLLFIFGKKKYGKVTYAVVYAPLIAAAVVYSLQSMQKQPPETKTIVHVNDEHGLPVSGASVVMHYPPNNGEWETLVTNNKGVVVSRKTIVTNIPGSVSFSVNKEGYYSSAGRYYYSRNNRVTGLWPMKHIQPWGGKLRVRLKRVHNPVSAVVGILRDHNMKHNVGFDMFKQDWLPPFGHGEVADITFSPDGKRQKLTFATKEDGIFFLVPAEDKDQAVTTPAEFQSELFMPYEAPIEDYEYNPRISVKKGSIKCEERQGSVFRIRTRYDSQGKQVDGYFGKILGPICLYREDNRLKISMRYLLSTVRNSRIIEFMEDAAKSKTHEFQPFYLKLRGNISSDKEYHWH